VSATAAVINKCFPVICYLFYISNLKNSNVGLAIIGMSNVWPVIETPFTTLYKTDILMRLIDTPFTTLYKTDILMRLTANEPK
jgi:hypothetical protein